MQFAKWTEVAQASVTREILKITQQPGVISFAGGVPAPELFPVEELTRAFAEALTDAQSSLQYTVTEGLPALRESVAGLMTERGVNCSADDIALIHGSQQGLDLVARLFLEPNDLVLVEETTYHGAVLAFNPHGVRFLAVRMDDQGMDVEHLRELLQQERPKLIYCTPTFQNPTSVSLSRPRRQVLAQLAAEFEVPVIEDDPYFGLQYDGEPQPVVKSFDQEDQVIYVGSFSKILAPGLRLGWVVARPDLVSKLNIAQMGSTLHVGTLLQHAVQAYLQTGGLPGHIKTLCDAYRPRRDAMLSALESVMSEVGRWSRPDGGFFVWVRLLEGFSSSRLLEAALAEKVAFVPGDAFYAAGGARDNCLRLSFSTPNVKEIEEGFTRLRHGLTQIKGTRIR